MVWVLGDHPKNAGVSTIAHNHAAKPAFHATLPRVAFFFTYPYPFARLFDYFLY